MCPFTQFVYLKVTTTTSYIHLLQDNTQGCKQVQTFFESALNWNSSCILGNIKLDLLVHLTMTCLLGYMIIDRIALKVKFLLFASFYTLAWHKEALASISAFLGDSGMTSEGNFNVYLCPWKVFHLKIVEVLLFLLCFLPLVFHFNLILINTFFCYFVAFAKNESN